mgnify:CR=1 FL=1
MKTQYLMTLVASLAIGACGGGGGSGNTQTPPPPPAAGLAITADNAVAATKASYEAALGSGSLTDLGNSLGFSASGSSGLAKPAGHVAVNGFIIDVMQKVPFGPDESPCAVAGSVTISGNIDNPLTLTPGDNFVVESTACDDGLGEVIDGVITFTVAAFDGDLLTETFAISMDAVIDDLQIVSDVDTITSNGDARVSLDTRDTPLVTTSVSGSSMTTDSNASADTLRAYSTDLTLDGATAVSTMVASGSLDTTRLTGAIDYSTPMRFELIGSSYPHIGELLVEGDQSSALLIAVDNVDVRIEIDLDANGSVDEIVNTTWAELEGG